MGWQKIKEKLLEHIVTVVLSLVASLCLIIWKAVPAEAWAQLGAAIPKRALAAALGIFLIALATVTAYAVSLRRQLKQAQAVPPPQEAPPPQEPPPPQQLPPPPPKRYAMFNVMWNEKSDPLCPVCDVLLSYSTRLVTVKTFDEDISFMGYFLTCPKCKSEYALLDQGGTHVSIYSAREILHREYRELPRSKP